MVEIVIEFNLFIEPKRCLPKYLQSVPSSRIRAVQPCPGSNTNTENEN